MIIRKMCESDISHIADMEKRIFSDFWTEADFYEALDDENRIFIVAEIDGKAAGYCGMWCVLDEGQIMNVAVDESMRRRGIAEAMLTELFSEGKKRGIRVYTLEVRESNCAAQSLYAKLGFKGVGRRPGYYRKPDEAAILMDLEVM